VLHIHMPRVSHPFMRHTIVHCCGFRRPGLTRSHSGLEVRAERGNQQVASLTEKQRDAEDGSCYEPAVHNLLLNTGGWLKDITTAFHVPSSASRSFVTSNIRASCAHA